MSDAQTFLTPKEVTRTRGGRVEVFQHFESWGELIDYAENQPATYRWKNDNGLNSRDEGEERRRFTGTRTFEEAVSLARYGWKEGREHLNDAARSVKAASGQAMLPAINYDVAGAYPIAPIAAAGDPLAMVTPEPQGISTKRIYRLVVETVFPHYVKGHAVNNWGGAILAWIDEIEAQGHRVELVGAYPSKDGKTFYFPTVTLKQASEPIDIDRVAFMLAHPANLRRLYFALVETHGELEGSFFHTYGCLTPTPKKLLGDAGARIPGPNNDTCGTPALAAEYVKTHAAAALGPSSEEEEEEED